jgi:hypothetical protein
MYKLLNTEYEYKVGGTVQALSRSTPMHPYIHTYIYVHIYIHILHTYIYTNKYIDIEADGIPETTFS